MLQTRQGNANQEGLYKVMSEYLNDICGKGNNDRKSINAIEILRLSSPTVRKHASPTKRLIKMKNTTFSHKKALHDNHRYASSTTRQRNDHY